VAHLAAHADPGVYRETQRIWPLIEALPARLRLPLIEMALPALRALTGPQHDRIVANVVALTEADDTIDLFEWSLHRILVHDLEGQITPQRRARVRHHAVADVGAQAELLLSTLAYVGNRNADSAASAFTQGRAALGLTALRLRRPDECGLDALDVALLRAVAASMGCQMPPILLD
jgi:hypothetical protein